MPTLGITYIEPKKLGNQDPESMGLLYGGHPHISLFFFLIDIGATYKMMHNNDRAQFQDPILITVV